MLFSGCSDQRSAISFQNKMGDRNKTELNAGSSIGESVFSKWSNVERNRLVDLLEKIKESLSKVIDPETGMDVMRMKLVRDLKVDEKGNVALTFRPSSVLCPLGFQLGISIKETIQAVQGVGSVLVNVDGFIHADQLRTILSQMHLGADAEKHRSAQD